jgi:1-acyl-sn-glycerol-3-phosphate acyltransferase
MIERILIFITRLLTGATVRDNHGNHSSSVQKVYFANHSSHLDFMLIWSTFPSHLRKKIRPVAAKDYWSKGRVKKYLITEVFNAVLIARKSITAKNNPISDLSDALNEDSSLIIFPEGGRRDDGTIGNFKSGIYHLAKKHKQVEFVPVYIENLNRILPKGTILPVPVLCSVTFGKGMNLEPNETKNSFLARAKNSMESLKC